jgi:uncharacterized protein
MRNPVRLVVDTNVLVSYLLTPDSTPRKAVDRILDYEELLFSEQTLRELSEVLARPKFHHLIAQADRDEFVELVSRVGTWIEIRETIRACRDPRDDKFLELAINGEADGVLTGDADLLALDPFRGIAIMTPAAWLSQKQEPPP